MGDNQTVNDTVTNEDELIPSAPVQFWTYLVFQVPSLTCALYLLYHLTFGQCLRRHLHNHVITVLLFLCLIILVVDNPLYLDGWRMGGGNSFPFSPGVCLLWWFVDYGFYGAVSVFLAWGSLERHIFIFYRHQCLGTKRKVFCVHYFPLIVISIYLIGFYSFAILFPPCENIFYDNYLACGSCPCYQDVPWINTWDYLLNGVLCNILEAFFSCTLLVKVIWRKNYSTRRFNWKKYRKMTVQLLSISILSLMINLPQSLIIFIQVMGPGMSSFGSTAEPYLFYFTGYIILLIPFVCLACLQELWPKRVFFKLRRPRTIRPMTMTVAVVPLEIVQRKYN
ncbi:unnamed protein product [Rotaria socialis]|uniref:Uncharacterized protein n=1 Tax=Rotaria socialis TaxID=392032 RepID=A0A818CVG5_9BILA|nr:unnamed protein product [Rotaria socialis]CAF3344105.1 unnamed protein product [Rotaria socialis]CAF3433973.1 unnamed protein product [Rotaria socialis]CAF3555279.1 unnamed protein product [Rotaria socialis]CAF4203406.1 unnamed protein product [Rotaria socialis]